MTDGNGSDSGRDLTLPANDPFLQYGGGGSGIAGGAQLLIYSKGEYNAGMDRVFVPLGTKMVFFMPGLRAGYRKWVGNQIAEEDMVLLVDRPRLPSRESYGDTDTKLWDGRDPWQETIVVDVAAGDGSTYTLPLSGVGGVRAGKGLILDYGKQRRSRPGQLPLVELGSDSYPHPKFGKIHFPVLAIVGWVDGDTLEPVEDVGGGDLPWAGGAAAPLDITPILEGAAPVEKPVPAQAAPAPGPVPGSAPAKRTGGPRF